MDAWPLSGLTPCACKESRVGRKVGNILHGWNSCVHEDPDVERCNRCRKPNVGGFWCDDCSREFAEKMADPMKRR